MTPAGLCALAREYHDAAVDLIKCGRRGRAISGAPARMLALHAIELYLSAFLVARGHDMPRIRGLRHDLSRRGMLAAEAGLALRQGTRRHLDQLTAGREQLAVRYAPDSAGSWTEVNRLIATLDEVARKAGSPVPA